MKKQNRIWRGLIALFSVLLLLSTSMTELLISWSGQVNVFLDVSVPTIEADEETMYYSSDYGLSDEGLAKMLIDSDKHDIQTMEEGSVLIKNDNAALPLDSAERSVTLFGRATADPVYEGNSGGPGIDQNRLISLHTALSDAGFEINETMYQAYENSSTKRAKAEPDWSIGEESQSFYTAKLQESYNGKYNDVAIVMFARDGGEGKDLATSDRDEISYLALHDSERELLEMIRDSEQFNKTIVLINSAYPMELGWLNEEAYGVDSALWIGAPGLLGFAGVANVLTGEADPSGRFVNAYAADSLSAPAVRNFGDFTFANDDANYVIQAEGIYVGYKYYETRYQDSVLDVNNANSSAGVFASSSEGWNYVDEMAYPFGYGLSYASFTQELETVEWDKENQTVTAVINVTNDGPSEDSNYTGKSKDVVELYAQLPYESGHAEKSAIQLIGFEKTQNLAIGESEKITITVDDYLFATYDSNAVNGADPELTGAYVFDAGDYYFSIGRDSHDALNNVLAKKDASAVEGRLVSHMGEVVPGDPEKVVQVTLDETDNETYARSRITDEIVSNHFDDLDYNYFSEGTITYLTRDDWNTYPTSYEGLEATEEIIYELYEAAYSTPDDAPDYHSFIQGEDAGINFIDMKDVPFENEEIWDKFINQLSVGDMSTIVGENFGQPAVSTVQKPANQNTDGPGGAQGNYNYGDRALATRHVTQIVASSTWNKELIAERGDFIAEDTLFTGTSQLWSPGANLHRTPFSGRNFEYYSEDSILTYILGSVQTEAMQKKGLNASIKHFVANDQETNRSNLPVYMNEQTYREGPLKGFEGAFTDGGALGTMMSFSRIGNKKMYEDERTLTQVLRNEWGFKGVTITDSVKGEENVRTVESLIAGTDTFNADTSRASDIQKYIVSSEDGYALEKLRETNKRFYYAMVNSNLVNGLSASTVVSDFTPWWQHTMYGLMATLTVGVIVSLVMFIRKNYFRKREEK